MGKLPHNGSKKPFRRKRLSLFLIVCFIIVLFLTILVNNVMYYYIQIISYQPETALDHTNNLFFPHHHDGSSSSWRIPTTSSSDAKMSTETKNSKEDDDARGDGYDNTDNNVETTTITIKNHHPSKQDNNNELLLQEARGKERILKLLLEAGFEEITLDTLQRLPTWAQITELYGDDGPVIHGLEHCETFRQTVPPHDAFIGPAGMFNTGTNVLAYYLAANCEMPFNKHKDHGIRWQVPWGKHVLASLKWKHTATTSSSGTDSQINKNHILPIILTRDPYTWMQSMCRQPYAVKWHHTPAHCPNLVPNVHDYQLYHFPGQNIPVRIKEWKEYNNNEAFQWPSLAHLWNDWYQQYKDIDNDDNNYPKIMTRFEDLLFYPRQVVETLCTCAGGNMVNNDNPEDFLFVHNSAKFGPGHGQNKTTMMTAMIQYGTEVNRFDGYTRDDLQFASQVLDPQLMEYFHYKIPEPPP